MRPKALSGILYAVGFIVTTAMCIAWIDRPVSLYAARLGLYAGILNRPPFGAPVLIFIAAVAVLCAGFTTRSRARSSPRLASLARSAAAAGLALSWATCVTEFLLKPLFGRSLPLEYIRDGTYAFHWFGRNAFNSSFPSGHAAQIVAIASVLWTEQPRSRALCVIAVGCISIALIVAEKHFMSDIIVGGGVGFGAGQLMRRLELLFRSPQVD